MSERFFDARERDLYLAVAQSSYRDYPKMAAEAVDRIAWQAVERFRHRNWELMMGAKPDPNPDDGPTDADVRGEVTHD
jgi:hypothetical protein